MKTKLHITHIRPSCRVLRPYGTYCYEAILLDKHDVIWTGEKHDTEDEALAEAKAELNKRLQPRLNIPSKSNHINLIPQPNTKMNMNDNYDITTGLTDEYFNTFDHEREHDSLISHMLCEEAPNKPLSAPTYSMGTATCVQSLLPYRHHGQWVFDDPTRGLVAEAFVCGMSEIIDNMLRDTNINPKEVRKGFRLTFSAFAFPDHTHSIKWKYPEAGGNVYTCTRSKLVGWLCPALYLYYKEAPDMIYFKVDRIDNEDA